MPRQPFTRSRIHSLGEKPTVIRDPSLRGFAVRIYPSGLKSFVLETAPGKFTALHDPFRDATDVTDERLKAARKEARRLLLGAQGGGGLLVERAQDRELAKARTAKQRTFRDAYQSWWEDVEADMPPTTRRSYRSQLTKRLLPHFGNQLFTDMEEHPEDIVVFRDKVKLESRSNANQSMSVITSLFKYGKERGWVKSIPTLQLKRVPEHPEPVELTEAQVKALFEAFKASKHPARFTCILCVITGCRRDEAEGITTEEIVQDYRGRWIWQLPAARSKQKKRLPMPLARDGEPEIAQAAAKWDASVTTRRSAVTRLFDRERKRLKLPPCGPHRFRARYITTALDNGANPAKLAQRMGLTLATLMRYAGQMTEDVWELAEWQAKQRKLT